MSSEQLPGTACYETERHRKQAKKLSQSESLGLPALPVGAPASSAQAWADVPGTGLILVATPPPPTSF